MPFTVLSSRRKKDAIAILALSTLLPGVVSLPALAAPPKKVKPSKAAPKKLPAKLWNIRSISQLKKIIHHLEEEDEERNEAAEIAYEKAVARARKNKRPLPKKPKERESAEYLEAYLAWLKVRAFPNDTINLEAYQRATEYRQTMLPFQALTNRLQTVSAPTGAGGARFDGATVAPGKVLNPQGGVGVVTSSVPVVPAQWQYIGPRNLTTPYQIYYGPSTSATSGRVNALAFHPTDSNTVYLASGGGGLWKTTDAGTNWTNVSGTFPTQNTGAVAVDPFTPTTVYAGLGDYDGRRGNTGGVMKSTDAGATWTRLNPTNSNFIRSMVSGLAIDPDDSNRIVAATGRSSVTACIYLSINGGTTWTANGLQGGSWSDLKISPVKTAANDATQPDKRFYYVANDGNGIWRSTDRGANWSQVANLPTSNGYIEVAPSATNSNVVYVINSGSQQIYQGTRNPATDTYTWTSIATGFPNGYTGNASYNWSQAFYDIHLEAVPQSVSGVTSDVLYNGLITISGKQGANSWQDIGVTYANNAKTHSDQHGFAYFPGNPNIMMFGNDGGVYGLTYNPTTGAYTISDTLSSTLGVTMFYYADFHPTNPNWAIGGTQDNATPVVVGDTGNWINRGGGDGAGVGINPLNPSIQYASVYGGGFYWTRNSWTSSSYTAIPVTSDGPFTPRLTVDPNYPNPLYYGGTNYLYRYNEPANNGSGWESQVGGFNFGSQLLAISVAPTDSRVLYVGTNNGLLYLSTNRGTSWRAINTGLPSRAITDVWVDPTNSASIVAVVSGTGSGHVWRCTNTAATTPTWVNISGTGGGALPDIPCNTITRDILDTNTFFVGTDIGVFAPSDGGTTWTDATTPLGLPNVEVVTLKAMPGTGYLMAATYGRGMWRIPLTTNLPDLAPDLRATRSLTRVSGNYNLTVTVTNVGGASATGFSITQGQLKVGTTTTNTSTALPRTVGDIAPGRSLSTTLTFPTSAGASGAAATLSLQGAYTYGSKTGTFGSASRVTLP